MYLAAKYVHVLAVVISVCGFFLRGLLMMQDSRMLRVRWVGIVPHINDTVLLVAALILAVMSEQYPFVAGWVTAKVFGVIAYIILGALALREAATRRIRIACWLASLGVFGWIVTVALTRQPWGFLAYLA